MTDTIEPTTDEQIDAFRQGLRGNLALLPWHTGSIIARLDAEKAARLAAEARADAAEKDAARYRFLSRMRKSDLLPMLDLANTHTRYGGMSLGASIDAAIQAGVTPLRK